jgi:hypothetical protein
LEAVASDNQAQYFYLAPKFPRRLSLGGDVCGLLRSVLNDGEVRALAKEGSSRNTLLLLRHLSLDDNLPTNSSKGNLQKVSEEKS